MVFKTIIENIRKRFGKKEEPRAHSWTTDVAEGLRLACRRPATRLPSFRQLSYIPSVMTRQEKRFFLLAAVVFLLSAVTLGIRVADQKTEVVPADGGSYVEGFIGAPQLINPLYATSGNDIDLDLSALVFSGLLRYNNQQELVGDLASSFEISQDQKQYTIVLRQNVVWHDGSSFGADDVLFTFSSIQDPQWKSPFYSRFKNLRIEKVDDATIRLTLEEPNALFLDYLTIGILPAHLWEGIPSVSATLSELNIKPIGTGPYIFSSVSKEKKSGTVKEYVFDRNIQFYREQPRLSEIHFRFYQDEEDLVSALKKKQIDGARPIIGGTVDLVDARNDKRFTEHRLAFPQYTAAFFNKKNSILKDRGVREALLAAIRKSEFLSVDSLQAVDLLDGPIPPSSQAFTKDVKRYGYDLKRSGELLDQAGFKVQDSGIRKKGDQELVFNLKTVADADFQKVAEILQKQWGTIGVKVNIESIEVSKFQREVIRPRNFDIVLATEYVGPLTDLFSFWHSTQTGEKGLNLSGVVNRDIDAFLEASRTTNNRDERIGKLREAQNLLVTTEVPALFLYQPTYLYLVSSKIKGIFDGSVPTVSGRFNGIETWYQKTKRVWK